MNKIEWNDFFEVRKSLFPVLEEFNKTGNKNVLIQGINKIIENFRKIHPEEDLIIEELEWLRTLGKNTIRKIFEFFKSTTEEK